MIELNSPLPTYSLDETAGRLVDALEYEASFKSVFAGFYAAFGLTASIAVIQRAVEKAREWQCDPTLIEALEHQLADLQTPRPHAADDVEEA